MVVKGIIRRFGNRTFLRAVFLAAIAINLLVLLLFSSVYIAYELFGFNSSNAVLYVVKDENGWIKGTNDLNFDESGKLLFLIDATSVFRFFEGLASSAYQSPIVEMGWDKEKGNGVVKEYRPDGSKFLIVVSRYKEDEGKPKGIFIGGDLQFGDMDRIDDRDRNNTGISFYDGKRWLHIWCSINEVLSVKGIDRPIDPSSWKYLGSRVIKASSSEVMLESKHSFKGEAVGELPVHLIMTRTLYKRRGDDYVLFKIEFTNETNNRVAFNYFWGDEPWVGEFGDSSGDIGWASGKVFKRESYVLPVVDTFAGYWDHGNDLAGEKQSFTNYANFIEWLYNPPTVIYFSNGFSLSDVKEGRALNSKDNRIINLAWLEENLKPEETRSYIFALGMAKPDPRSGLPMKPKVNARMGLQ